MDNAKNDLYYINKIKKDLNFIVENTKEIDSEELGKNEILLDSMLFRLIQISENSKKLSDDYKRMYSEIPWLAVYGLRNRIVHDYGHIDLSIIYSTLKNDIPELLRLLNV